MKPLILKLLSATKNQTYSSEFENAYESHPNFPSLLAVTDSLTQLKIDNIAANIPFNHVDQLPEKYLAQLNIEYEEIYFITTTGNSFTLENGNGSVKKVTSKELEKYWTGIVLLIDENEENLSKKVIGQSNYLFVTLLILLVIVSLYTNKFDAIEVVFTILLSIGLYVSVEILRTYFKDNQNNESKFCSVGKNFSCKSIINSKSYSFSKYVEFVDLPIVFFSAAFLSQILNLNPFFYFGIITVLSFPFLLYSIYLQKFVLRKWCLLCLIVSIVMISIIVLFLLNYKNITSDNSSLISILIVGLLSVVLWIFIKKQLIKSRNDLKELNKLLRFKRDDSVFSKIALQVKYKDQYDLLNKISIGDRSAKNTITLFLSPSCPHCHSAYKNATELVEKNRQQLKLEVCYNLNINNHDNPNLVVAKTIFYLFNSDKNYKEALDDWHINSLNLEDWEKKWFIDSSFTQEKNQIEDQYQWCTNNQFNYAPVKIFNGVLLPDIYELNELFYFFKE